MSQKKTKRPRRVRPLEEVDKKRAVSKAYRIATMIGIGFLTALIAALLFPLVDDYVRGESQSAAIDQVKANVKVSQSKYLKMFYASGKSTVTDPFTKEEGKARGQTDKSNVDVTTGALTVIGTISIPKIREELPIYNNTSTAALDAGTGLLEGSSPLIGGAGKHSVITGHRGRSLSTQFTNLPQLKLGDKFYIRANGEIHAYQVDHKWTVYPDNLEHLKVVPGKDLVTLITCTPIFQNTKRLLVQGHRIPYHNESVSGRSFLTPISWGIIGLLVLVVFGVCLRMVYQFLQRNQTDWSV